jgi:hypothetical protein
VISVSVLFALAGSVTGEDTDAVLVIKVPVAVAAFTFTTIENVAVASSANVPAGQLIDPDPPTAGVVQPADGEIETNVVLAGVASVRTTPVAGSGPSLSIMMVQVMFDPAATGSAESVLVTERSAGSSAAATGVAGSKSRAMPASTIAARRIEADTFFHLIASGGPG